MEAPSITEDKPMTEVVNETDPDPIYEESKTYKDHPTIRNACLNVDACNQGSSPDGRRTELLPEYKIPPQLEELLEHRL
jgi:hypothetical protein